MVKGCGPNCARIILIIFNIIFWLSGAALLALGIYMLVGDQITVQIDFLSYLDDLFPDTSQSLLKICAYAFIAVGIFVILVGFCGCFGAIKESKCLLGLYIFFLMIVMLCEIAIGAIAIYFRQDILDEADELYPELVEDLYSSSGNFREVVNNIQYELECCGWSGVEDYENVTWNGVTGIVPSCCIFTEESSDMRNLTYTDSAIEDSSGCQAMTAGTYQTTNCMTAMEDWIDTHAYILIGVGIGIACLELFGMIFACCLCRNIEE